MTRPPRRTPGGLSSWFDCARRAPSSAVVVEEAADILEQEASITALAHAVVLQLAAVTEALHRVDVEMKHLRDLSGGEHLPKLVQCHRAHPMVPLRGGPFWSRAT